MDPGVHALFAAFGVGFAWFFVCCVLFTVLRKHRAVHIDLEGVRNTVFSESDTPLAELLGKVWSTSLAQVYQLCGLEAYMYMALHVQLIICLGIMSVLGCGVLVPVYLSGADTVQNDVQKTGILHILSDEDFMGAAIAFFIVFSVLGYYLVYTVMRSVYKKDISSVLCI